MLEEIFIRKVYQVVTEADLGVRQIVDLGANVGMTVRLWMQHFPDARIIAVEPDEANLGVCRANAGGGHGRVVFLHACVADKPGESGWIGRPKRARSEWAARPTAKATQSKS